MSVVIDANFITYQTFELYRTVLTKVISTNVDEMQQGQFVYIQLLTTVVLMRKKYTVNNLSRGRQSLSFYSMLFNQFPHSTSSICLKGNVKYQY